MKYISTKRPSMNDTPEMPSDDYMNYPSVHLSDMEGLDKIPDEGSMHILHKVLSRTKTERDGKTHHAVEIAIKGIKPKKKSENDATAMRDLLGDE